MITERDLKEAIAECQGVVNPTSSTCLKLASYFIIKEHMFDQPREELNLKSTIPQTFDVIEYHGNSEFAQRIDGRYISDVIPIIDELMTTLQVVNPRLYNSVIDRL